MARSFSRASSQYLLTDPGPLAGTPSTLAVWFRRVSSPGAVQFLMAANSTSEASGLELRLTSTYAVEAISVKTGTPVGSVTAGTAASGTWALACGVFVNANSRTAYLNAVAATANTVNSVVPTLNTTSLGINYRSGSAGTGYLDGELAHAAIWNAALTQADIDRLYNGGIGVDPRSVRPDALVAYWPLLENDGDRDWWGQFNLTANNTPTYAQHPPVSMRSTPRFVIGSGVTSPVIDTISIAGTRQVGNTLTCNATSSPGGATFTYQWYVADDIDGLNETPISGATSQTYELSYANVGAVQKLYEGLDDNGEAFIACGATPTLSAIEGDETVSDYISITEAAAVASIGSPFESRYIR